MAAGESVRNPNRCRLWRGLSVVCGVVLYKTDAQAGWLKIKSHGRMNTPVAKKAESIAR